MASCDMTPTHAELKRDIGIEQRCYLFGLPEELRLIIYEKALSFTRIEIKSYDTPSIQLLSDNDIATTRFHVYGAKGSASPQLLRTCRQVHQEGERLLYRPECLCIQLSWAGSVQEDTEDADDPRRQIINMHNLRSLRRLDTLDVEFIVGHSTVEDDVRYSRVLGKMVHRGLQVNQLNLVVWAAPILNEVDDGPATAGIQRMLHSAIAPVRAVKCVAKLGDWSYRWCEGADSQWEQEAFEPDPEADAREAALHGEIYELVKQSVA
ncbi:hypothetical protein LTR36_006267 [Oleoguttula mirabilis]|uniref:Uncharacterized protein n=1 Tax=Oleoguttula mirabilis TaxID=1507867 RepID=A0AAV9JCG1_9PEZI|nr:hypothetical protein LTR36_006267 [Oleoguttula mirabilis]